MNWASLLASVLEERGGRANLLWRRVFITSRGWTASVDIVPAERPAMVSTSAGEMRAWSCIRVSLVLSCWELWWFGRKRSEELAGALKSIAVPAEALFCSSTI